LSNKKLSILFKSKRIEQINSPQKKSLTNVDRVIKQKKISRKKRYKEKLLQKGSILILLGKKYNGKKCVFLKYSREGALIVSGPYSINGVPLRRINHKNALQTEININLTGLNIEFLNDKYFDYLKKSDELSSRMQKEKLITLHRIRQKVIDKFLEKEIKKNFFLEFYLKTKSKIKN
jgi:large subunit ribosomal protein L6e